jgi:type I restriction enzyme S subunit
VSVEELFGELPKGWDYQTLGEVCAQGGGAVQTGPFGSQLHAADYVPVGIPSIMPQNIGDNRISADGIARITTADAERLSKYRVKPGDIVYSRRGDVERRALVRDSEDGWLCGTGCLRVRLGDGPVDPIFAAFYLGAAETREWIVRHAHGATMPNLNTSILSACPIIVPPLPEQRAIAATLGALDDKIELNRKMNATLESMARALFRDWFVDFGPTRAKMEARAPYLSPDLWSLFPDRLDDEGTPEGWKAGILGDVATAKNEGVDPSSIHSDTPYIGLEHMPRGSIALNDWEGAGKVSSNKAAFAAGDFLFGKLRPYFHKVGIAPVSGICSTDIVVVRPKSLAWAGFVIACISDDDFVAYTDKTSTGTKMPRTSWTIMSKYPMVLPSSQLAEAFNATVGSMLENIRSNIRESRTLAQTRDLLLPRLISGDLRVLEATLKQEVLA